MIDINIWKEHAQDVFEPYSHFWVELDVASPAETIQLKQCKDGPAQAQRYRFKVKMGLFDMQPHFQFALHITALRMGYIA